jgi:phosphate transport system substrate-binding protein
MKTTSGILAVVAILLGATSAASAQTIVKVDGSTGAMPLVSALAKAHETQTTGVKVEIGKGLGTKARIDALKQGSIDIAVASHGLKAGELTALGMVVERIAGTAVTFAVDAAIPVTSLTPAQICSIYSGTTTNWKEVGGPDAAIAARTRPDSEVDTEVVRAHIGCLANLKMPADIKVMDRSGDMARELVATPGSLGMTTTTVVLQSNGKLKTIALDGIAPTEANVVDGRYRLVREVFLVTSGAASPATKAFVAFVKSPQGAAVIKNNGAIPGIR